MKASTRATLLSALAFPGVGYFSLGATRRGLAVGIVAAVCFGLVFFDTIERAQTTAQQILDGKIDQDLPAITQHIRTSEGPLGNTLVKAASGTFFVLWLIGIVDCYRLGRQEKQ